jgi:tetratricopeptide (TPR) repeat protein
MIGSRALCVPLTFGPLPTSEALAKLDSYIAMALRPHPGELSLRAVMLAMLGQIEEAWALGIMAAEQSREVGIDSGPTTLAELALIAGDLQAADEYLRSTCEQLERRGALAQLSTYVAIRGRAVCMLGRPDEAEQMAQKGRELCDPDDVWTQALWRQAQALVHSARGEHDEAVRLAEEAVGWWSRTDSPLRQGEGYGDLAQVLEAAGRRDEAIAAWRNALHCYERKEVLPSAERVRKRLAALEPASA